MRKNTNTTTNQITPVPAGLTRGQVEEIVDEIVRAAVRDQARNLEKHLKSIHERLVRIETHGALR
jgi:hypothetical protein|tara:strand:+ start:635 stop:829 length:195 start_codon:yes stop_codon:yes gene_type:complete